MKALFFALALLALSAIAHDNPGQEIRTIQKDGRNCRIRVWARRVYERKYCPFSDQIQVGVDSIEPLKIICGYLDVDCRDQDKSEKHD